MGNRQIQRLRREQAKLNKSLKSIEGEGGKRPSVLQVFEYYRQFDLFAAVSYRLRDHDHGDEDSLRDRLQYIYQLQPQRDEPGLFRSWYTHYRQIWRQHLFLLTKVIYIFLASLVVGYFFGSERPDLSSFVLGAELQEKILTGDQWFQSLAEEPLMGALSIALNNVKVCINIFIASALLGVGGLLLLIYNGFLIATIFGHGIAVGFDKGLLIFVATHGPLELSLMVASAFCGLIIGKSFFEFGQGHLSNRLSQSGKQAFTVMIGILPWIVFIAFFEGFVSPFDYFDLQSKLVLGASLALVFWLWTFWKPSTKPTSVF